MRYAPHSFKVGFRNNHTANRRRSSIKKHLSKIIVFTIRQRKIIRPQTSRIKIICILHPFTSKIITSVLMPTVNNTNLGFTPCFWLILRYAHGLYGKVLSRSRALSYSKTTTENLFTTENAEISDDFWKRRTQLYFLVLQASIFHKSVEISAFWQRYRSIRIGSFPRRVSMVILYTIKNHLCTGDYAAAVCTIKSTQLKQGRTTSCFTSTQEQYPSLFGKRFNFFVIRKATFRTRKRFHNKQYTPKSKDQPLESDRTHFYVRFNKSNVAMHRPTFIFLLSHKITTVQ